MYKRIVVKLGTSVLTGGERHLNQARMVDLDALRDAGHYLPAINLAANLRGATIGTDLKAGTGWRVT